MTFLSIFSLTLWQYPTPLHLCSPCPLTIRCLLSPEGNSPVSGHGTKSPDNGQAGWGAVWAMVNRNLQSLWSIALVDSGSRTFGTVKSGSMVCKLDLLRHFEMGHLPAFNFRFRF